MLKAMDESVCWGCLGDQPELILSAPSLPLHHWNENVAILTTFSSLAALEVVILTTSSTASDENVVKMMTFPFQWLSTQGYADGQ